eukprot:TRINITY_DN7500_c0_g1_i1.p1 TRINITY_DN7500_c0_g1~~TRINITY_DN7500_c0_g1_i1.p1  ORF type:complete len:103 (+),score=14.47 TRINITY_DN7500_c0_g1_i1:40-348(+)
MASFVQNALRKNAATVFAKSTCPYCIHAIGLLQSTGAKFTTYHLDLQPDGNEILDHLKTVTGARTVPRVFVKSKFIGGCDDTVELHRKGGLVPLLKEAGALD